MRSFRKNSTSSNLISIVVTFFNIITKSVLVKLATHQNVSWR